MISFLKNIFKKPEGPLKDKVPWITFEAKEWLDSYLDKEMTVFEWGCGGSTLYLASRVKKLFSIEHNKDWFKKLKKLLDPEQKNCEIMLMEPELSPKPKCSSDNPKYRDYDFSNYCDSISKFPDGYFDLIIVDGRARKECILRAKDKVRPKGFILVDDSDRSEYEKSLRELSDFTRKDFYGPGPYLDFPWGTSIFQRHG